MPRINVREGTNARKSELNESKPALPLLSSAPPSVLCGADDDLSANEGRIREAGLSRPSVVNQEIAVLQHGGEAVQNAAFTSRGVDWRSSGKNYADGTTIGSDLSLNSKLKKSGSLDTVGSYWLLGVLQTAIKIRNYLATHDGFIMIQVLLIPSALVVCLGEILLNQHSSRSVLVHSGASALSAGTKQALAALEGTLPLGSGGLLTRKTLVPRWFVRVIACVACGTLMWRGLIRLMAECFPHFFFFGLQTPASAANKTGSSSGGIFPSEIRIPATDPVWSLDLCGYLMISKILTLRNYGTLGATAEDFSGDFKEAKPPQIGDMELMGAKNAVLESGIETGTGFNDSLSEDSLKRIRHASERACVTLLFLATLW